MARRSAISLPVRMDGRSLGRYKKRPVSRDSAAQQAEILRGLGGERCERRNRLAGGVEVLNGR
jgi:hypothetical protein